MTSKRACFIFNKASRHDRNLLSSAWIQSLWIPELSLILSKFKCGTMSLILLDWIWQCWAHCQRWFHLHAVTIVTELVDDGTNFNNCFQMKRHSSHVKYVVTLHRNVFLWNMCTLSTNTASSQNKTLFSCEAHFILSGTCTMPWNKKLLMRFISDKPG